VQTIPFGSSEQTRLATQVSLHPFSIGAVQPTVCLTLHASVFLLARHRGLQIALATLLVLLIAILVQFYAGDQVLAAIRRQTKGTDLTVQPTVQAIVPVPEGHVPDVYSTTSPANI